jgi:hypothetical protein
LKFVLNIAGKVSKELFFTKVSFSALPISKDSKFQSIIVSHGTSIRSNTHIL